MRFNRIYFTGDTHSVSLQMTAEYITKGQPHYRIVTIRKHGKYGKNGVQIPAGRKGSRDVINNIKKTNGNVVFKYNSTFAENPDKLNFAVQGTLIINGKQFNDIILAQGHTGFSNNWWFTGKNCRTYNPHFADATDFIATDETDWSFTRGKTSQLGSTSPNHVKLRKKTCHEEYQKLEKDMTKTT